MKKINLLLLIISSILIQFSTAIYIPGNSYVNYAPGDPIEIKVQKLASNNIALPYEYYSLPFCKPAKIINNPENFGEILFGDRIENSLYTFKLLEDFKCKPLPAERCIKDSKPYKVSEADRTAFKDKISGGYYAQMIIDNLPIASLQKNEYCGSTVSGLANDNPDEPRYFSMGYAIGCLRSRITDDVKEQKYPILNNHLHFKIRYHSGISDDEINQPNKKYRIVGAGVIPSSVKHSFDTSDNDVKILNCSPESSFIDSSEKPDFQTLDPTDEFIGWTYSVEWQESMIKWASRWDFYLNNGELDDTQVHWFSIINSLMIVLFLTGMVAMIMLRTLKKDFAIYSQLETTDEAQEETGWKLVHREVFRTPVLSNLFSVFIGTGVQINVMTIITLIFALLGFLSPANRGILFTVMILLFIFTGSFAGYVSAVLYKMFKGQHWKRNVVMTATIFPGTLFGIFFVLNGAIVLFGHHSTGAVPFLRLLSVVALWFGISLPLVFVGSYLGKKRDEIKNPCAVNLIPRRVPDQPWYMRPPFSVLMGGILPFGAVFIELFFILTSIWLHRYYYVFGFLFVVFIILVLTCAEITIVMIYFQLCSGDYNWWWRSFFTSGSSGLYLFLYSIFYYFTKLNKSHFLSAILFFGYMLIISYFFFVLTGAIGFIASFMFIRKIYSVIRVD